MGRSFKEGLDYFPVDTGFYEDDKILLAEELADPDGTQPWIRFSVSAIALRMFREIYKDSYYIEWNDRVCLTRSSKMGAAISHTTLKNIINCLLESSFFSKELYTNYGILTSHGIQKKWVEISKMAKRKNILIIKEYCLVWDVIHIVTSKLPEEIGKTPEEIGKTPEESAQSFKKSGESTQIYISFSFSNNKSIGNKGKTTHNTNNTHNVEKEKEKIKTPEEIGKTPEEIGKTPEEMYNVKTNWQEKGKIKFTNDDHKLMAGMTEDFKEAWLDWLNYLSFEHNKELKTTFARQPALEKLVRMAGMDELVAIKIIRQSISSNWKNLFELQIEKTNENGKRNSNSKTNGHQPVNLKSVFSAIDQIVDADERRKGGK